MTRATYLRLIGLMLILTVVQSVIMLIPDWNGMQGSAEADEIDLLLDVMIVLSSFVFAIVIVMLGYCIYKYRAKPGDESDGKPIHGNTRLEIAWTLIPTVIVLFAAAYSWVILDDIEAEASENQMPVNVTAQQFKWTFEYPETGVVSDEFHVPSGVQLELSLSALEVLHSFWVPEWRIKRDLVPIADGNPTDVDNVVRVTPDVEGTYTLVCTELCGWGHSTMQAKVVVESQEEFDAWMQDQEAEMDTSGDEVAEESASGTESEEVADS
ncbi:MAG: cytochrome c oxidase subunit II [Actinomycetota bacterium]|nr:cytochrome c oxidase subunit II [Actinomycetota bacterium]